MHSCQRPFSSVGGSASQLNGCSVKCEGCLADPCSVNSRQLTLDSRDRVCREL